LRHQATLEGGLEDGLLQPRRVGGFGVEDGLGIGGSRKRVGDKVRDFGGFGGRRDSDRSCL